MFDFAWATFRTVVATSKWTWPVLIIVVMCFPLLVNNLLHFVYVAMTMEEIDKFLVFLMIELVNSAMFVVKWLIFYLYHTQLLICVLEFYQSNLLLLDWLCCSSSKLWTRSYWSIFTRSFFKVALLNILIKFYAMCWMHYIWI